MTDRKFGRKKEHRERTLRNLATSILLYEKVVTTEAKAKTMSPMVERLIQLAIKGDLASRRHLKAVVFDENAVSKLFEDFPARQGNRTSGFVRITKLAPRAGDGAPMAQLELLMVPLEEVLEKTSKTSVKVRKAAPATASPVEE